MFVYKCNDHSYDQEYNHQNDYGIVNFSTP